MVFAEKVLSMQTMSLATGTVPPLQFEAVAQELSPAVPVHCFVPVAQVATAAALQKAIHESKTTILPSVFMWISPRHLIADFEDCEDLARMARGEGRDEKRHIVP
jgi:hypothetical protein